MSDWMLVVMVIVVYLLGFIVGLFAERRKNRGADGILIVDKVMPEANGGVYFQAFANPPTYTWADPTRKWTARNSSRNAWRTAA